MHIPEMIRELHFAGSAIHVEAAGKAAQDLIIFLFNGLPAGGPAQPHVSFHLSSNLDSEHIHLEIKKIPGVDFPTRMQPPAPYRNLVELEGPANTIASQLLAYVDFHLADRSDSGLYLHSACLETDGKAVLMPGSTGQGKTTLTYFLSKNGFRYMSDEAAFIPLGSLECIGFPRPIHLKPNGVCEPETSQTTHILEIEIATDQSFGQLLDYEFLNPVNIGSSFPVKSIIFPAYQEGRKLSLKKLSTINATFELAQCLINARNLVYNGFPEIQRLTKSVPCYRMEYADTSQVKNLLRENNLFSDVD